MNRQRLVGLSLPILWLLTGCPVWAAAASAATGTVSPAAAAKTASALFAAPVAHPVMPGQAGSLIRVVFALLLVLVAVFAAAWFSRRMQGVGSARNSALQVVAQLSLGPRERAVLVRVGDQQVLLGVASGNVRALHVLPEGTGVPTNIDVAAGVSAAGIAQGLQRPSFRALLLRSLGK